MTAIAGCWRRSDDDAAPAACATILEACAVRGDGDAAIRSKGGVALGCRLRRVLPEDRFDGQPVAWGRGGLLVFDGRLDNRDELAAMLGLAATTRDASSDSALFALAWERRGIACLDHLLGDFAAAAWDGEQRRLTLLRSPLSMRGLFFTRARWGTAFASSIGGLLALDKVPRELDEEVLLGVLAGGTYLGTAGSLFRGVQPVRQGHAVLLDEAAERVVPLWDPPAEPTQWRSVDDCGDALRADLDRAVDAQLRRSHGQVAAHLSSGRDSGAVAATAARHLGERGETLLAYTGAPAAGFAERAPDTLLVDESAMAATVACLHRAMRHQVCRGSPNDFGRLLEILQDAHGAPLLTPSNLPWWDAVNRQAAADGATVLLTGQVGNYSISAGGPTLVRDLAREGRWGDFLRGAGRFAREHGARNATTRLLGPLLPASLYDGLRRTARGTVSENELPLIRGPWRRRAEELRRERLADHRPPASYRAFLRESLLQLDNAERMSAAVYGLDVRDPTADRRLVELVMTFPATALFGREDRPAFARAFADRLPSAVIASRNRAYQQSDWFERLDPADVLAGFRRLARHPLVDELIDAREVERMVEAWPLGTSWMADPRRFAAVEDDFRNKLLPTLAVATFVGANFPG